FIDGNQISDITLDDINIEKEDFINIKIGVKEDARNVGGVNLFGKKFGNYRQDIILRYRYKFND
ncbi:MAG: transcriptional regulator, partial [Halanaerobium sp.]